MSVQFDLLTRTGVATMCRQAHIAEPRDAHPLQLLVSALHARARLHNKIPDARPAKPHKQPAGIDVKKLQAGDHDD